MKHHNALEHATLTYHNSKSVVIDAPILSALTYHRQPTILHRHPSQPQYSPTPSLSLPSPISKRLLDVYRWNGHFLAALDICIVLNSCGASPSIPINRYPHPAQTTLPLLILLPPPPYLTRPIFARLSPYRVKYQSSSLVLI
jgi:hypothetical protein